MTNEFLNTILEFTGPAGLAFVSFILLVFVWAVVRFLLPVLRATGAIKRASKRIASGESEAGIFRDAPDHLKRLWNRFLKQRAQTTFEGGGSPVAPEHWFTPTGVLPTYNRSGALALAGAFAGLGILGTFVGLMIGLINIDTAEGQVLGSVTLFISGMSTAFWSSIFGIGASLVWLAADRATFNRLVVRLNELHSAVRHNLPTVDSEQMLGRLVSSHESSLELLRTQKAILQNLGTDITSAFEEAINRTLTPAMSDISESLDTMSVQVSDRQAEALGQMAEKFQEELMGRVASQFDDLAESVRDAADYQARVNEDVSNLFDKLTEVTAGQVELIEQTRDASETFSSSLQALGTTQDRIADAAEKMALVTEKLDSLSVGLYQQAEEYNSAQEQLQELMAAQLDASAEQVARLDGFFTDLSGDLQNLSSNLERSVTEFSGLAADKLTEVFHRFDSELSKVVDHLSGTLAQIRDVTEDMPRAVEDLRSTIGETTEPIRSLEGRLASAPDVVASLRDLRNATEQTARRLQESGNKLARLEEQLASRTSSRSDGDRPSDGGDLSRPDEFEQRGGQR